jgi:hypothetical protein
VHGRTLRSLPKTISDHSKNAYDIHRHDEANHDAMILWLARDVMEKYGFGSYWSSLDTIAAHISAQTIGPLPRRARHESTRPIPVCRTPDRRLMK